MAIKKEELGDAQESAVVEFHTIEELRDQFKTRLPLYTGMCAAYGWAPGKKVSAAEYLTAEAAFAGAPMDGKRGEG